MKSIRTTLAIVAMLSLLFAACKKGDTGPAGAQGPTGSANVQYSNWTQLNMNFNATDSEYEQVITVDSLKQPILDSGVVLTYMKFTNPNTGQTSIVNAASYMDILLSVGKIDLLSFYDFSGFYFRYVLIPGGLRVGRIAPGSIGSYSKAELQKMSYDQIMKLLGQQ